MEHRFEEQEEAASGEAAVNKIRKREGSEDLGQESRTDEVLGQSQDEKVLLVGW